MFKTMFKNKKLKKMINQIELMENMAKEEEEEANENCSKCGKNNRTLSELNLMYNNLRNDINKMNGRITIIDKSIKDNREDIDHVQSEVTDAHQQYQQAKTNQKNFGKKKK